ncbi:hypothetical protein CL622_08980 [archaeon]|nr:hypothetical protein [archaeon]|tara:strand:+ start:1889 stop:2455 length:567 start_codon:yes stop_codon:yes gene_type:complete
MFLFEPKHLKKLRMRQGLTQAQLAKESNVSQSVIAKIESGRVDPSYSSVKQIIQVLQKPNAQVKILANDLYNPKVISVDAKDSIKQVISTMKEYQISQVPVLQEKCVIGLITESTILERLSETSDVHMLRGKPVSTIIEMSPPLIPKQTPLNVIMSLLSYFPMVVVFDKQSYLGVITKSDILNKVGGL